MSKTKPRATKVMIIRHADKPPEPPKEPPPFGVTREGTQDEQALIVRGWQRAGALASFFDPASDTYGFTQIPQRLLAGDSPD